MNQEQIENDVILMVTGICIAFNRDKAFSKVIVDEALSRVQKGEAAGIVVRGVMDELSKYVDRRFVPPINARIKSAAERLDIRIEF